MDKTEVKVGSYVEFIHYGFRLGRVVKMNGGMLTVVLAPFTLRGRFTGKRVRVHKEKLTGILYRKKVIRWLD